MVKRWSPCVGTTPPNPTPRRSAKHDRARRGGAPLALQCIVMLVAIEELFGAPRPRLERVADRRPASRFSRAAHAILLPRRHGARRSSRMYGDQIECVLVIEALKYMTNTSETRRIESMHIHEAKTSQTRHAAHHAHTETEAHERTAKHAEPRLLPHVSARIAARATAAVLKAPTGKQHSAHARRSMVDPSRRSAAARAASSSWAFAGAAAGRRKPRPAARAPPA